jgi:Zn finger protein HypA/HybF involved in hydrogenase expression
MIQTEGSILAQVQEIVKDEFDRSVYKYQLLENGQYDPFVGVKQAQRRIDIVTEVLIALECAKIFCAVHSYKTCKNCDGDRYIWTGSDSYRCPKCNIRGEIRV